MSLGADYGSEIFTFDRIPRRTFRCPAALIIVITLALSNMCLNHLILPIYQPTARNDIYRWLLWKRRTLIAALIWIGFLFYYIPDDKMSVLPIGNVSYIASLQFLPSIVALLYWPRGNKRGFVAGLIAGIAIWFLFLMVPAFSDSSSVFSFIDLNTREIIAVSLVCNIALFVIVSLMTHTSAEERASADICALDTIRRRNRTGLVRKIPGRIHRQVDQTIGRADRET